MTQNQLLDIRRLVIKNSNTSIIGNFKNILLDFPTRDPDEPTSLEAIATVRV